MGNKLNVLVSAYACSPEQGSEAGVGWGFIKELSELVHLTVLVDEKYRSEIQNYCTTHCKEKICLVNFHYIKRLRLNFLRKIYPPSYYWTYKLWQFKAYKMAKAISKDEFKKFDICHHLTMVGFREPGFLYKLNIPFVIGPVGGAGFFPMNFITNLDFMGAVYYLGYNLFNAQQMAYHPRLRKIARLNKSVAIAATFENRALLEKFGFSDVQIMPEIGIKSIPDVRPLKTHENQGALKIVWCGKLIPRKGLKFLLIALSEIGSNKRFELQILGDGPLRQSVEKLIVKLNLQHCVKMYGNISRDEAVEVMRNSDIGVITSLRDLSSTVTLEMQHAGLAMIVPDHSGFSVLCDKDRSQLVKLTNPKSFINDLKVNIEMLLENADRRNSLREQSQSNLYSSLWREKAAELVRIYTELAAK